MDKSKILTSALTMAIGFGTSALIGSIVKTEMKLADSIKTFVDSKKTQ